MIKRLAALALALSFAAGTALAAGGGGGDGASTESNPDLAEAKRLIKQEQHAQALPLLQRVVAKDSKDADAWNLIGFSNRELKRYDAALDGYSKALAINPRHTDAIEYLGELYLELGDLAQAEAQLAKLDDICFFGCKQYDMLKTSIAQYKQTRGS